MGSQKGAYSDQPHCVSLRYHSAREARHCRECARRMPMNFTISPDCSSRASEVRPSAGNSSSRRISVCARRNPEHGNGRETRPAGGLTDDGDSLCVRRSKDPRRDNPYAFVHDGLKELLAAHKRWHQRRYPKSPWYFPGRDKAKSQPISEGALTKSLERLHKEGKVKRKITSHGMRAFYVLVRPLTWSGRSSDRLGDQPQGRRRHSGECLWWCAAALAPTQGAETQMASEGKACLECDTLEIQRKIKPKRTADHLSPENSRHHFSSRRDG